MNHKFKCSKKYIFFYGLDCRIGKTTKSTINEKTLFFNLRKLSSLKINRTTICVFNFIFCFTTFCSCAFLHVSITVLWLSKGALSKRLNLNYLCYVDVWTVSPEGSLWLILICQLLLFRHVQQIIDMLDFLRVVFVPVSSRDTSMNLSSVRFERLWLRFIVSSTLYLLRSTSSIIWNHFTLRTIL